MNSKWTADCLWIPHAIAPGFRRLIAVAVLVALAAAAGSASPIITGGTETQTSGNFIEGFTQGYRFQALNTLRLTSLGVWDFASDGFRSPFDVGVWDEDTEALVASATVTSTDPLDTSVTVEGGQWRYAELPLSVLLSSGKWYLLGVFISEGLTEADTLTLSYATMSFGTGVAVDQSVRAVEGASLAFPSNSGQFPNNFRAMGNARFEVVQPVPEPSTWLLLTLGMAVVLFRAPRRLTAR